MKESERLLSELASVAQRIKRVATGWEAEFNIAVDSIVTERAILDLVGLGHKSDSFPTELSGGEQQRLAIARAIVNRPAILIADEPTANLDADNAILIMDVLIDFNRVGVTTLIASHDLNLMARYARRTLLIQDGRFSDHPGVLA